MQLASLAVALLQAISWRPAVPEQGSLITISAPHAITGQVAGEPLHFRDGRALAAVPLGAEDSIPLHILYLRWDGMVQGRTVYARVVERHRVSERIQAAPRFTPAPDSALLVRINAERVLSRDASRRAHALPPLWTGPFTPPRPPGTRVTSPFGGGRKVNGVWRSVHYGLDLAGRKGEPVRASNRGIVALVGDFFYGGLSIYVLHGGGLITIYHHLSRALVTVGDTVERGQIIGRVGATGRVTGPHLHWQSQYGSVAFDPTDLLSLE